MDQLAVAVHDQRIALRISRIANGLNPRKYIQYILSDIPGARFHECPEFLEDYLPWNEYVQKICR